MEEDESEIGEAATTEHLAAEGAVEVEDESEIDEAATTEHPQGTVEVEEEEQSQIDEARKTDYHAQPLAKLPEKRKRSCLCLATDSQISAVMMGTVTRDRQKRPTSFTSRKKNLRSRMNTTTSKLRHRQVCGLSSTRTLPFQEALVFSPQSHVVISTSIPRSSWVSIHI